MSISILSLFQLKSIVSGKEAGVFGRHRPSPWVYWPLIETIG
jgi:hypothetical protein